MRGSEEDDTRDPVGDGLVDRRNIDCRAKQLLHKQTAVAVTYEQDWAGEFKTPSRVAMTFVARPAAA